MQHKPPWLHRGELQRGGCCCLWQSIISNNSPLALQLLNIFLPTKYPARLQAPVPFAPLRPWLCR